jgi:polysaccharide export outer membrane protein
MLMTRSFSVLSGLILALAIIGCSSERTTQEEIVNWTVEQNRHTVDSDLYVIQKGDQVEIQVAGYPEFSVTLPVKENGMIALPLVGDIRAQDLTKAELTGMIDQRLSSYAKNKVTPVLKIKGALEQKVIVLGSVSGQGTFQVTSPMSPFQALALAGGPTPVADLRHVRVFRGGKDGTSVTMDLSATLASLPGRNETLPLVYPGDLVYIPREENIIREFSDLLRDVIVLFGLFALVR